MKRTFFKGLATIITIIAFASFAFVLSTAADIGEFYMFNIYQTEFTLVENNIIVKDAVSSKGYSEDITIHSLNNLTLSADYEAWCSYCDIVFADADNLPEIYDDYFDEEKSVEVTQHKSTALYSALKREAIISVLTTDIPDMKDPSTIILKCVGENSWCEIPRVYDDSESFWEIAGEDITINFNGINTPITLDGNNFLPNENTRFVFATLDGVFTYSGIPQKSSKLTLNRGDHYRIENNVFTVIKPEKCLGEIAKGYSTSTYTQTDIVLDNDDTINFDFHKHTKCAVSMNDNKQVCDSLKRTLKTTWGMDPFKITENENPVQRATVNSEKSILNIGEEIQLKVDIAPANADYLSIKWTSSSPDIISIDENGLMKALSSGEAMIRCIIIRPGGINKLTINRTYRVADKPSISLENAETVPGRTVRIPISIANNPGVSGIKMSISYDPQFMLLKGVEYCDWEGTDNSSQNCNGNLNIVLSRPDNYTKNTVLAYLIFEAKNPSIAPNKIEINSIMVCNEKLDLIDFDTNGASIIILTDIISGDTNGDGEITVADAVLLAQYLAGWQVKTAPLTADCNGDGIITVADAVLLAQHLAGWEVSLK